MNVHSLQPRLELGDRPSLGFAQLTNMGLGLRTYLDCEEACAKPGHPRFGILYGPSGYGKSVAMAFTAQRTEAIYIEAKSIWTVRSLLEAISLELGLSVLARSAPRLLQQIIDELNREPRGLIVDETDYLVKKAMVDVLRDIHDATQIPILLVGEESLPAKLKAWDRFDNRILVATPAQPATLADALKLRDHYCPRVAIADDLVAAVVKACGGVTRRIVTNLTRVERTAVDEVASSVDLAWWGDRRFSTGDVTVRRLAA